MRILVASLPVWCLLVARVWATPLTYDIGRFTLLTSPSQPNPQQHIVTGTITTNGKIGRLESTDFLSWSISVDGPSPYSFHPGNPGPWLEPSDVDASLTGITTVGQFGWLFIGAFDNTARAPWLKWSGWGTGGLSYIYYGPQFREANSFVPGYPVIIATRVVPEPSGWLAVVVGIAIFIGAYRVRINKNPAT